MQKTKMTIELNERYFKGKRHDLASLELLVGHFEFLILEYSSNIDKVLMKTLAEKLDKTVGKIKRIEMNYGFEFEYLENGKYVFSNADGLEFHDKNMIELLYQSL